MRMNGFQESMKVSMSYEEVAAILQDKLGNLVEMEPLLEEKRNKLKENEKDEEEINERLAELMADRTGNDKKPSTAPDDTISDLDYLVLWEEGDTLYP